MKVRGATSTLLLGFLCGCSGPLVNIAPVPPAEYSEGDKVTGSACGLLLLGMVPMGVNGRAEEAYDRALEAANATSLTDTALTESWYFTPVGPAVCTSVGGTALVRSTTIDIPRAAPQAEFRENHRSDAGAGVRSD